LKEKWGGPKKSKKGTGNSYSLNAPQDRGGWPVGGGVFPKSPGSGGGRGLRRGDQRGVWQKMQTWNILVFEREGWRDSIRHFGKKGRFIWGVTC